jgi:hypothetical protein
VKKIQTTRNYRMFTRSEDNRGVNLQKHKSLIESMKEYGFIEGFPVVCIRGNGGVLIVKDGQHRLAIAEMLDLPVSYVEIDDDFNIAKINGGQEKWTMYDYAHMWSKNGREAYTEALAFTQEHKLQIGAACAILSGTTSFTNIEKAYRNGDFVIKDREWADAVASLYGAMVRISPSVERAAFLNACMAVCRVKDFDQRRLVKAAERCRNKLVNYATRDAYLDMIEDVYNFGAKHIVGLKIAALMAMRERCAVDKHKPN